MKQYLELCQRIVDHGQWVTNKRTGTRCLTVVNAQINFDASDGTLPVVTTRKAPWKLAIAELIGYLRGYDNAADFRALGAKSWDANANENADWLANPARKGKDDLGRIYGAIARAWPRPDGGSIDTLKKIVNNLSQGIDDRGEILTFNNPGEFHLGALRPCLHTHQFSLLGDDLYLSSTQRSMDAPLGGVANAIQVVTLLRLMAQITGTRPAGVQWTIVNAHIYENQLDLMKKQLEREPYPSPVLEINPGIQSLGDIDTWVSVDDFSLHGYRHHSPIKYPFSV